jgi:hypothetical protein
MTLIWYPAPLQSAHLRQPFVPDAVADSTTLLPLHVGHGCFFTIAVTSWVGHLRQSNVQANSVTRIRSSRQAVPCVTSVTA